MHFPSGCPQLPSLLFAVLRAKRCATFAKQSERMPDARARSPRATLLDRATPRPRAETGFTRSSLVKLSARPELGGVSFPTTRLGEHRGESYGLLSDQTLGGPSGSRVMPAELYFFSWWNEELPLPPALVTSGMGMGVRRQMELCFLTREGVFQLVTDDARVPISFRIDHANGSPLQATELHVGARIDVSRGWQG